MDLIKCNGNRPLSKEQLEDVISRAAEAYENFLTVLGFDWKNDPHMSDTGRRVAKAWVNDLASGCYAEEPEITAFPNDEGYAGLIIQKNIPVTSMCAHHNLPFTGTCTIAYIPSKSKEGLMVGLSKLNRVAHWFARRPNVQESLTKQIHDYLSTKLVHNRGVAVIIEAKHECVSCRGVRDSGTSMVTSQLSGYFFTNEVGTRVELFRMIGLAK